MRDWLPGAGFSLVVHLAVVALLGFSMMRQPTPVAALAPATEVIEAVAIDEEKVQAELERLRSEERRSRDAEQQRQKRLADEARKAADARKREEQRLAEVKRQAEQERQKAAAAEKQRKVQEQADQQRLAKLKAEQETLKKRQDEEKRRLADLEQQRKLEAQKRQEEAAARQKAEAEKKRLEEEARKRQAAEAELRKNLAAEQQRMQAERQRQLASLIKQYEGLIAEKVGRNWLRPADSPTNFSCKVLVKQLPGGDVVGVQVIESCGNAILDRSVENAVRKASPLPQPPDPELFDREIEFTFVPRG